jgi:hypothetical protein
VDELDTRLRRRHQELLARFTAGAGGLPRYPHRRRLPGLRLVTALGVAVLLMVTVPLLTWHLLSKPATTAASAGITTTTLDGVTLTVSTPPPAQRRLSAQEAIDIVQNQLNEGLPAFSPHCPPSQVGTGCENKPLAHVRAVHATFVGYVERIRNKCGGVFAFTPSASAWFVQLSIPPQDGFTSIVGGYAVNDKTATIIGGFFAAGEGRAVVC